MKRTAHAQGVALELDASLLDHLASDGYRPEFGARELRRLIRTELETQLARAMLAGEVVEGAKVTARWDATADKVAFRIEPPAAPEPQSAGETKESEPAAGE